MTSPSRRRLPIGAEVTSDGVHFRIWAPDRRSARVVLEAGPGAPGEVDLAPEEGGYFSGTAAGARAGTRYRFRLGKGRALYPDPASRFQPEGPHGPSEVVDPSAFCWTDSAFAGARLEGQILYEIHVGTFTPEGTWEAAERELPELAALGITAIELMPIADFPGRFGWGYDGVNLFAPTRLHGAPDDLRRFVDRAHGLGIAVILDVVYNHLGPDGNYLSKFSRRYFTSRHRTDWGAAIDFDGPSSGPVREYFISNAGYWIDEFHVDGLRLDAVQCIFDRSREHVLAAIGRRVREAARGRGTIVIAEADQHDERLFRAIDQGGHGLDAAWNDDLHHSAMVALTGLTEGYYAGYRGTPQELCSAIKWGCLYQGQHHPWFGAARGMPARGVDPTRFVVFLENHDQVSNSADGRRLGTIAAPGQLRALTALLLLSPGTPMLFQGQEFAASAPFVFFADHHPELNRAVKKGRGEHLAQFVSLAAAGIRESLPDPGDPATFARCKLDRGERVTHGGIYLLHLDLIELRRGDAVIAAQRRGAIDGAVLGPEAFALRWFGDGGDDRLLLVNLGAELDLVAAAEPLLAPPERGCWALRWSSESARYGGGGAELVTTPSFRVPGCAAILLAPAPRRP